MKLLDDLGLWLVLGPPLGVLWLAALASCARWPGELFARGLSRRSWLWILTLTGFLGAAAWFALRPRRATPPG